MKTKEQIVTKIQLTHLKKFQRTKRKEERLSSRSQRSDSSVSSSNSFYIPQKRLSSNMRETISIVEKGLKINFDQSFSSIKPLGGSQCFPSDFSELDSFERSRMIDFEEEKKVVFEQNQSLKKENEQLKRKLKRTTEILEEHLKKCENKTTNKMKGIIKEARVKQLQEKNQRMEREIRYLRQQISKYKIQMEQLKQASETASLKQSTSSFYETCHSPKTVNQDYVEQVQKNVYFLKDQNKQLKLKIDCINRQFYKDMEMIKTTKQSQIKKLREKYLLQSQKNRKLSRENVEACVKIKKLQKDLMSSHDFSQTVKNRTFSSSKKMELFLQLSSDDEK